MLTYLFRLIKCVYICVAENGVLYLCTSMPVEKTVFNLNNSLNERLQSCSCRFTLLKDKLDIYVHLYTG